MHNLTCILTLFFVLCAGVTGQAATKKRTGWQEHGLKGKVKTRAISNYEIKIVFGESRQVLSSKSIYKYDATGNMIELAYYNADGSLSGKTIYKYDAAGNKIEAAEYKIETKFGQTETVQTGLKKFVYEYYGSGE